MRRTDREVADKAQIMEMIKGCDSLALALNDEDGYPYVVEMNFGFAYENGRLALYLHGAKEGKKRALIARDAKAAFSMSRLHGLVRGKTGCSTSFQYESVCGRGKLRKLDDSEGAKALGLIMRHYCPEYEGVFEEKQAGAVDVYEFDVESFTGKRRSVK